MARARLMRPRAGLRSPLALPAPVAAGYRLVPRRSVRKADERFDDALATVRPCIGARRYREFGGGTAVAEQRQDPGRDRLLADAHPRDAGRLDVRRRRVGVHQHDTFVQRRDLQCVLARIGKHDVRALQQVGEAQVIRGRDEIDVRASAQQRVEPAAGIVHVRQRINDVHVRPAHRDPAQCPADGFDRLVVAASRRLAPVAWPHAGQGRCRRNAGSRHRPPAAAGCPGAGRRNIAPVHG